MTRSTASVDVAIIGGGLAGLACGLALEGSGLKVAVYEGSERLGGRAQSWPDSVTGDVIDLGPHILLSEYHNMLAMLDTLGTRQRIVWETDRLIRLRDDERTTDMHLHHLPPPLHLAPSFARVASLGWRDKLSNLPMIRLAMRADETLVRQLDQITAAEMLAREQVSEPFIKWFWATACLTVMNVPLERCSAGALLRVFAQLIGRAEYRIGFAASGLAELFADSIAERLTRNGGDVYLRTPVRNLVVENDCATGLVLQDGTYARARYCVSTVPPADLHELLPRRLQNVKPFAELAAFEPSPYISSYLWFDRKLTNEKFWTRVWDARHLSSDFYDLSNIRSGWQQRPSLIASNIIYSHRAHALTDEQIVAQTYREIAESHASAAGARVTHAVVNRIPMAIPCPTPHLEGKRPDTVSPVENLLLAGDWVRTDLPSCMESAVVSGYKAAEHIWQTIGRSRQLVQPVKQVDGFVRLAHRWHGRRADSRSPSR